MARPLPRQSTLSSTLLAGMLLALLSACAQPPEWTRWDDPAPPEEMETDAEDFSASRVLGLLQRGEADRAADKLRRQLDHNPDDPIAQDLLRQIEADPEEYLGAESFQYSVRPGESLSVLAQRFLGDHQQFFILARYNDIQDPSRLRVGQQLSIPGSYREGPGQASARMDRSLQGYRYLEAEDWQAVMALYQEDAADLALDEAELLGQAHQGHIQAALDTGELDAAESRIAAASDHPASDHWRAWLDELRAEWHWAQGRALRDQKPADAADAFREALTLSPTHEGAQQGLENLKETVVPEIHRDAVIRYRNQDLEVAIELWDTLLAIDPDFEPAQLYRARAVELQHRLEGIEP
ncbi:LysM peptidoglycan-binding domain-containing protein [Gammaproteobacteria bacterium AB-CW1]|uniref:LysM peptidoglycan-binding domain-containing protein n=1 Tax=Natronospira elongata TaxID=3110268 RepID=A0AAP6JGN5_9GAMM|nr:LysM peptidoglycan-binding domain-containing protein [Gammaproteobacteria bacterium AB-CW1]MEA5446282.1 LysM peptidoglycan-binding domain-containing protein [Gammaproteobacteria bacterium AB-CW1]